jgi:dUTP pyrophosphatase
MEEEGFPYTHVTPIVAECQTQHPDAVLPCRKRSTDAAYDVTSVEDAVVPPHGMVNVDTGVVVTVPPGYYLTVEARSSLGKQGIIPMRGIIDATYTGPLKVILTNQNDNEYKVCKGDRIAQIILHQQLHIKFQIVEGFSPEYSKRGSMGWGSSGR